MIKDLHYAIRTLLKRPGFLVVALATLAWAVCICRTTSQILLRAIPNGISVEDIKDGILNRLEVLAWHHLHIWQLNETKYVASLHI